MKNNNGSRYVLSLMLCLSLVLCLFTALAPVSADAAPVRSGEDQTIVINMFDSAGDGWTNNAINILENGTVIGTATVSTDFEATWTYTMDPAKEYAFVWVKGTWSSECSFDIIIAGETVFSATGADCNLYVNGFVLYPACEHTNCTSVVTPPTCKEDGYTTYTCTVCGKSFTGDETPATGHDYGDDDICVTCGHDKNSVRVVISMTDSFGDGWNGNAIEIYEDGVLIDTATLGSSTRNGTWTYDMSTNKAYEFFWKKGNFANECSFTITINDEEVFSATGTNCSAFNDGHVIYPPCTHTDCDAEVTPPTCTKIGYTTYTCKKCGHQYVDDVQYALGHDFGDDSVCDTCGYDKDGYTINMTDSYGDGWNGNAIEVYEDGVHVGTATLTSGSEGSFFVKVDPSKEYTFCWVKGNATYECSFEIIFAGETVLSVTGNDMSKYISGQQIYPYVTYSGWTELGGKVYYFDPNTNEPLKNAQRLPYPTKPLNGITYAPNPEDVAYAESIGEIFMDLEKAWFLFDGYSGELMQNTTAVYSVGIEGTYEYRYVVNGMIPWHVGLVYEYGYYYYFTGDTRFGGNRVVIGDGYVSRNNTDFDMVVGGLYTFDWIGHMCMYEGVTEVDGVLRYYENARLMIGNGLTKVGDNLIFVDANGELLVNGEYYVPANELGVAAGIYTFDENGYLVDPISSEHSVVYSYDGTTHTVSCTLCGKTTSITGGNEFKINSAYLTLASDVSVIFRATIPAGFENAYMAFDVNGVTYIARSMGQDAEGRGLFSYPGINPQMMGDNIHAVLYAAVDGMAVSPVKEVDYSVLTYCNKQLPTAGKNFKTLISDLLVYGAASQVKMGYKTDALVTDLATTALTPSTFPGVDAITNKQGTSGDSNDVADVTGVGLNLSNQVVCKFGFTINDENPDKYTIKVQIGEKVETFTMSKAYEDDGKYWLNYCNYSASQFDETITVTLWEGETQIGRTFTYSVNSYFYKNANSSDAGLATLVQAVYNYGVSAANYVANPNG